MANMSFPTTRSLTEETQCEGRLHTQIGSTLSLCGCGQYCTLPSLTSLLCIQSTPPVCPAPRCPAPPPQAGHVFHQVGGNCRKIETDKQLCMMGIACTPCPVGTWRVSATTQAICMEREMVRSTALWCTWSCLKTPPPLKYLHQRRGSVTVSFII